MKFLIAIDFETTGFSPKNGDAIVEIGAVKFNLESGIIDEYSSLVNPQRPIPTVASNVHGIRNIDVADAAVIAIEWSRFTAWADEPHALVAHNAWFEKSFINSIAPNDAASAIFLDTLKYSRLAFPALPNHQLKTICDHIGYSLIGAHRALPDARATASLLIEIYRRQPHLLADVLASENGEAGGSTAHSVRENERTCNSNVSKGNPIPERNIEIPNTYKKVELRVGNVHDKERYEYADAYAYYEETFQNRSKYKPSYEGSYHGDWEGGKPHGQGKQEFANGDVYEGEWLDGLMSGCGRYVSANGDMYEGEFLHGEKTGKGTYSKAEIMTDKTLSEDDVIKNNFRVALTKIAGEEDERVSKERAELDRKKFREKEAMGPITTLLKLLNEEVGEVQGLDIMAEDWLIVTVAQRSKSTFRITYDPRFGGFVVRYTGLYRGKHLGAKSKCESAKKVDEVMEKVIEFVGKHIATVQTRESE